MNDVLSGKIHGGLLGHFLSQKGHFMPLNHAGF
jgi:hypothetical protein